MEKSPARARSLAFLISGLVDCLGGGILLLAWLDILPLDLTKFGLTRGWVSLIGTVLAISGVVVVTYQLTKLKEPDQ